MEALHDVVKAGKARYIGASSMYAWQFAKASRSRTTAAFVSMQNHYNLVYREEEREMIPQCLDQGIGVLPWSPLARGLLAGNRTREGERRTTRAGTDAFADRLYDSPSDFDVIDRVAEVAAGRGVAKRAGGAGVAAAQARRDSADHRGDEDRAPRGRDRRRAALAQLGRDRPARGAVRPARDLGPLTVGSQAAHAPVHALKAIRSKYPSIGHCLAAPRPGSCRHGAGTTGRHRAARFPTLPRDDELLQQHAQPEPTDRVRSPIRCGNGDRPCRCRTGAHPTTRA